MMKYSLGAIFYENYCPKLLPQDTTSEALLALVVFSNLIATFFRKTCHHLDNYIPQQWYSLLIFQYHILYF